MKTETLDIITHSEEETITLGERIGRRLRGGDIIALHGELGAGKTRLVRGMARGLGLDPSRVCSPTFVVANEYSPPEGATGLCLIHIDAYRLRSTEELGNIGWDRMIDGNCVVVIEWAERIQEALPPVTFEITLAHQSEDERLIRIEGSIPASLIHFLQGRMDA